MPLLDLQIIAKNIVDVGETVTLRTVTKASYSNWGDATKGLSDEENVTVFFNIMVQDDVYNPEAIFKAGDILFWFKGDQSNVDRGNRIYYNSTWYEILEVIQHRAEGTTWLQTAKVKKI